MTLATRSSSPPGGAWYGSVRMQTSAKGLMDSALFERVSDWLGFHPWAAPLVGIGSIVLLSVLAWILTRRLLLRLVEKVIRHTEFSWDDVLIEKRVLRRAAALAPLLVVFYGVPLITGLTPDLQEALRRLALAGMAVVAMLTISALLSAVNDIYTTYPIARGRPIKGYLQVINIFVFLLGGVLVVALLLNRSPWYFMTGIGAMTAVLLLIFRDTILSLVASIQIVSNDMVRIGDWIEMSKYGADGDVVDIALHTVKVQNFDKTITTIPTYKLIDESFRNWRGMKESGGRRIKRAIHLDMSTIRFLEPEDIDRFSRFVLLHQYVEEKRRLLEEYNREVVTDSEIVANARRLTNVGTFRAYLVAYLRQHPMIYSEGMTFLIRQLEPGPEGLPIELYVFTRTTDWGEYEAIQADVFDHILAIVPEFGLRVFQKPTGSDLQRL